MMNQLYIVLTDENQILFASTSHKVADNQLAAWERRHCLGGASIVECKGSGWGWRPLIPPNAE
ncbi:hypothetical protein LCGC14_1835960 [marine sediment metagenome]|uniref:GIY-YIG domain-containing protein n=1 Tax=marine sediment metagenome TaxID=412755 RepID=A0A0F9GEX4_9ZZZZ